MVRDMRVEEWKPHRVANNDPHQQRDGKGNTPIALDDAGADDQRQPLNEIEKCSHGGGF